MVSVGGEYGTALQAVSYQGHLEIVMLLLDKGADPNVQGATSAILRMYDRHGTYRW
jgi:ankyrin repeat protein